MLYKCSRCEKIVEKLVPIDDAYKSAEESADWSAILEVSWPSVYTDYVCVSCAREILDISDEDLIREERLTTVETKFHINILKGRLAQVIIEVIFQEFGYEVYPYGYESYLTNIIKFMKKGNANIPARKVRATPDLFVYDRELNDGFFLEVKATNTPDETKFWISKFALQTYITYWIESILVIYCMHSMNIYCLPLKDVHIDELPIEKSPRYEHENCIINLKSDFSTLPNYFRLIEASKYQDFCQRIRKVLEDFHKPTF